MNDRNTAHMVDQKLPAKVKGVRQFLGISATEIASRLSMPNATFSKIENGKRRVTIGEAVAIAEALGLHLADLLEEVALPEVVELRSKVKTLEHQVAKAKEALEEAPGIHLVAVVSEEAEPALQSIQSAIAETATRSEAGSNTHG